MLLILNAGWLKHICIQHELASDLQIQLKAKAKEFVSYSLAADESTDRTDTAQLSIFIRGVDAKFSVTEELLDFKSIHGTTTGWDIFTQVGRCINETELQWDKLAGINGWCTCDVRGGLWFGRIGSREDGAHGREIDSLPLHHPPGGPLWKGFGHGTCNDSFNQNGELHSFTGLESPAI